MPDVLHKNVTVRLGSWSSDFEDIRHGFASKCLEYRDHLLIFINYIPGFGVTFVSMKLYMSGCRKLEVFQFFHAILCHILVLYIRTLY